MPLLCSSCLLFYYTTSLIFLLNVSSWRGAVHRVDDEKSGHNTMVMIFTPRFSGRYVTLVLTILLYLTLIMAVFARPSLEPLSLIALLSLGLALKIVTITWNDYANVTKMLKVCTYAFLIHLVICIIIFASSLMALLL